MNRKYIVDFIFRRFKTLSYNFDDPDLVVSDLIVEIPHIEIAEEHLITILGVPVKVRRFRGNADYIETENSGSRKISLNFDILAEINDYLTLEIERETQNEVEMPVVDLLIHYLYTLLRGRIKIEYRVYKGKYDFVICITHDVDRTGDNRSFKFVKNFVKGIVKKNFKLFRSSFSNFNDDFQFENILQVEKKYGVEQSTWYFLTSTQKVLGVSLPKNADYDLNNKFCQMAINLLKNQEIGLHIPFVDLTSESISKEKKKLEFFSKVIGARAHYLKGDFSNLVSELEKSDFFYDTTFGSNTKFSFRFGTSFPFHPTINDKTLKLFEVPLNVMDINLSNFDKFTDYIKKTMSILKATHGVLVINWHPNRFNRIECGDTYEKAFEFLLQEGKNNNAWLTSIQNLLTEVEK